MSSERTGTTPGWVLAAFTLLFHLVTIRGYGIFRDELYYLACSEHLDWGYVDHPPLIAWITAAARAVLGDSLPAIRFLPALAAAITVWLVAATARELGGGRFAQTLAGLAAMLAPIYVGLASFLSMNAYDILVWALCFFVLARLFRTGNSRLWLAFGAAAGVGLENKISVLFLGFGVVVGLLLSRRWEVFKDRWFWLGGLLTGALFLPHVLWQIANGWPTPEFMDNARRLKMVAFSPGGFLAEQVLLAGPASLLLWLAGLAYLLSNRDARPFRPLGWAYLAALAVVLASQGKPYYVAPAYTVLFAAGGVALERWTAGRRFLKPALVALFLLLSVPALPLAKPILPVETYVRYARALGMTPGSDERHEMGRLPQFFADMHGWRELAETVAQVHRALPPEERAEACIFGNNYGQAGAIDFFGPALGLPKAISGHNSYFLWGPRDCSGEVILVIGGGREDLARLFASVEEGAVFTCKDCMPYENGKRIWIARGLRQPLAQVWPEAKSYI